MQFSFAALQFPFFKNRIGFLQFPFGAVDIKGEKPHGWDIAKSKFSLSA
jgi:hypothetical protein